MDTTSTTTSSSNNSHYGPHNANPALLTCSSPSSSAYRSLIASKSHVYTCGQNTYGELGQGDCTLRKSFTKVSFLEGKGIVSVGAGNEHTIFVCEDGKVFVTGYNDNGEWKTTFSIKLLSFPSRTPHKSLAFLF